LANSLGFNDFRGSNGWLDKFKKRHSIVFKTLQGESAAVDVQALSEWQRSVLKTHLERYDPENVFNADESGLFFKALPNKSLEFKGERFKN
jgi:Tc5 transposase DNA-binding domain